MSSPCAVRGRRRCSVYECIAITATCLERSRCPLDEIARLGVELSTVRADRSLCAEAKGSLSLSSPRWPSSARRARFPRPVRCPRARRRRRSPAASLLARLGASTNCRRAAPGVVAAAFRESPARRAQTARRDQPARQAPRAHAACKASRELLAPPAPPADLRDLRARKGRPARRARRALRDLRARKGRPARRARRARPAQPAQPEQPALPARRAESPSTPTSTTSSEGPWRSKPMWRSIPTAC